MIEVPIEIGNVNLTMLKIGHGRKHWEANENIVVREIMRHDLVIMEYHPGEHKLRKWPFRLLNDRIDILNSTDNYLFIPVADICEKLKKDVRVFDPAYNESFILLHTALFAAAIFPPLGGALAMARKLSIQRHNLITRRVFIKGMIAAACAATATLLGTGAVVGPNRVPGPSPALGDLQNEFRRCVVAQHTVDLGASLPEPTDVLMIYTVEHGNGIRSNIENESRRRQTLERYLWLGGFAYFRPLFQARHYPQGNVLPTGPVERTLLSSLTS